MAKEKTMKLASREKRFLAACIDWGIIFIVTVILVFIVSMLGIVFMNTGDGVGSILLIILLFVAYIAVQCCFYYKSQSIGKAVLGLQVVSSQTGDPIGFWKMLLREVIVKKASSAVLLLGYIWIFIDEKNRTWHDKILDTYVVDLRETEKMRVMEKLEIAGRASGANDNISPAARSPESTYESVQPDPDNNL